MDDIHHMETMTKETDHILREQFVNRITRSDSAVRKYLGIPSITMLFGIFGTSTTTVKYNPRLRLLAAVGGGVGALLLIAALGASSLCNNSSSVLSNARNL
uniref:Uncharacterized protein n=1 Tax=Magallana gigas TaxID=29159 RepID=K1QAU2_MAGGI